MAPSGSKKFEVNLSNKVKKSLPKKLNIEKKFKFNDKIQQIPKTKTNKPMKNRALAREI